MLKKLVAGLLGALMIAGVAWSANPGDKGVSYKDNTAYCLSVEKPAGEVPTEVWVHRTGHSDEWARIEAGFNEGIVALMVISKDSEGNVWYRQIVIVNIYMKHDSGWRLGDYTMLEEGVAQTVEYWTFSGTGWERNGTTMTFYDNMSKAFVEGIIWDMANTEYTEGQAGN